MRFASLGSGSRGNACLVEAGTTRLLLDCGFSARELERRLGQLEIDAASLEGILVTHEHQDHVRGVGALARRYRLPVWLTHGTQRCRSLGELPEARLIHAQQPAFRIGALSVTAYPVPHDAREPVQFVFSHASSRLGVLTDVGVITPHIVATLSACSALFLECNHDPEMLANGPYPPALQRRVGGSLGHLSNQQAAGLLRQIDHPGLQRLVIGHISEKNNTPGHVTEALERAVPRIEQRLALTSQESVSHWYEA
ncbi:MAG: MBL fold metallo-hydrolase [Gammaproteobacteria bacterium]|nr:MBL fold metallo-hydrolase [Gammaproteobacteria bacterium]